MALIIPPAGQTAQRKESVEGQSPFAGVQGVSP